MKVLKYKRLANSRYQIDFDNGKQLLLYEEIILKYELLLKREISDACYREMEVANQEWDVYYVALKMLRNRFKSAKELRDSLLKKEYPVELIDKAIDKLLQQKYLDDRSFTRSYLNNQIITSSKGPNKLRKELFAKGVASSIVEEEIVCYEDSLQEERIHKLIKKAIHSNHTRGGMILKNKIVQDLIQSGYDSLMIQTIISEYEFENDSFIAKKEYEKLYRRLSRKYEGKELEFKIKEKLYQKGLSYENQNMD